MNRDDLANRVSVTIRHTSLFRTIENALEHGVVDGMAADITDHLCTGTYSRTDSLDHISEYLENELDILGIDLEDNDADGIALAILFVYEELLEHRSDFFSRIQEKSIPMVPADTSDSDDP